MSARLVATDLAKRVQEAVSLSSHESLLSSKARFVTADLAKRVQETVGTPAYVYCYDSLVSQAKAALQFPNAFGLTVRYAMKANSNSTVLEVLRQNGIQIDASSGFECIRAMASGYAPSAITLSSQELQPSWLDLFSKGVGFNACSLKQIQMFGETFPGGSLGIRFNPGLGSGHHTFANVGGRGSSFGIWHTYSAEVLKLAQQYKLRIFRIHTHIGSGVDPEVWERVAGLTLEIVKQFKDVTHVNLGGGFKIARVPIDKATNIQECGSRVRKCFEEFALESGRQLHLEIEPGTFLVGNAGSLVARVEDVVETGAAGHNFIKLNCGMGEIMRPMLYGAQHPIVILNEQKKTDKYVVVGHCCESGDALSMGEDGAIKPRELPKPEIGDFAVIEGCGAYCASMSVINYNSYPQAPEVMLIDNRLEVIRVRQTMEQMLANERLAKL